MEKNGNKKYISYLFSLAMKKKRKKTKMTTKKKSG